MYLARIVSFSAISVAIVACNAAPADDAPPAVSEPELIGDIESMQRLPNGEYVIRCRNGSTETRTVESIAAQRVCEGGGGGPTSCVRRCASRDWRGDCTAYAADYCAQRPACVALCTARDWRGDCTAYGEDTCASGSLSCVKHCSARDWRGDCTAYVADICATGSLSCVEHCSARDWRGDCTAYGDDVCGNQPSCTVNCTARDWRGDCTAYGEDHCSK